MGTKPPSLIPRPQAGKLIATTLLSIAISTSASASNDFNKNIENALKIGPDGRYGKITFNGRLRYENASTWNTPRATADALTFRLRLGYLSPDKYDFQGYAEFEANQDVGVNTYNSIRNGKSQFDIIADPQEKELNQLWLRYKGITDTTIKVGRQRIKIDNERFIGNVGWRQLEQTFDAAMLINKALPNTTIVGGYIVNTRDIFSRENDMDSGFVNIAYDLKDFGKLSAYSYLIDFNEAFKQNQNSNQTYGIRLNGRYLISDNMTTLYTAEYARQQDFGDNPIAYDVSYYHLMGGASAYDITVKAGVEQLDGQNGIGFTTALGTNHAFQGWADQFLTTPGAGVRDVYGLITSKIMGVKLTGIYHDFDDDTGNINYGSEWNFMITKKFGKHYSLLASYAYYETDTFKTDTQKIWLQAGISF